VTLLAIVVALILSGIFIALNKENPLDAFRDVFRFTLGSRYGFSETVVKSIPLIFAGLAVAIALRSNLWNIGVEGQLYMGALFATAFVLRGPLLPRPFELTVLILFGCLGGLVWAAIPAVLKIRFQMNEVISTLLLNYVAIAIVDHFVYGPWKGRDNFPYTVEFPVQCRFYELPYGRVHMGLLLAIGTVVVVYVLIKYLPWGYAVRLTGASLKAAAYAGVNTKRTMMSVFLLSGAVGGLAGVNEICGIQFKLHHHISSNYGYIGIIVAWLARGNPFTIIVFAFFLSTLLIGAENLQITMGLPASVGVVMQGLILFSVLGSELLVNYKVRLRKEPS